MISKLYEQFNVRYGLDVRSLALFRIALAACVLTDLGMRALDLTAFYTDEGIVPRERLVGAWGPKLFFSLHNYGGNFTSQALIFSVHAVFACMLLVGYRTRIALFMTWFLTVSLHGRNYIVLQGGDDLVRVMLFWAMFVPLSVRYSFDAVLAARRGEAPVQEPRILSMGTTALVAQLLAMYIVTATLKTGPTWQIEGSAVHLALHHHAFVTRFGRLFALLPVEILRGLNFSVWWLESLGPLLFFIPVRTAAFRMAMVLAFMSFHFGLFMCMELGPFPWVAMACWIALLPSWFWDEALPRVLKRKPIGEYAKRVRAALPGLLEPVLRRLAWYVAAPRFKPTWVSTVLVTIFACYAGYGTSYAGEHGGNIRGKILDPLLISRLHANWGMFAPNPPSTSGWFVSVGKKADGEEVDVWNGGVPVTWDEPELPSATYRRERWRKFSDNIINPQHGVIRPYLMRWLCREWNQDHSGDQRVEHLTLYHMAQTTRFPLKGYGPVSKNEISKIDCPAPEKPKE